MTEPILGKFNLETEIERFTPGEGASGRRAETLIKTDGLRVVLVVMRSGAELQEHSAPGPITIQTLRGQFVVRAGDEDHELKMNDFISIGQGERHTVRADEDGAFLLTIG